MIEYAQMVSELDCVFWKLVYNFCVQL